MKEARDCEGKRTIKILGYEAVGCPARYLSMLAYEYMACYANWQRGMLPNSGGWLDQPMKLTQAIDIVASVVGKIEEEDARYRTEHIPAAQRRG